MGQEIERKYLVRGEYKNLADYSIRIRQGYISTETENTVRIRITDDKAYLTIKGKQIGISRFEWEKEIALNEAEDLIKLCTGEIIEKIRYIIKFGIYNIEVDEFSGGNSGLTLAEIEFESENQKPDLPAWIGTEVSRDFRYHNSNLSKNPYSNWNTT